MISGDAMRDGDRCFQLTDDDYWQGGGVWYRTPIDLNHSFEMEIDLSFGCNDRGADGIVFIFHPELRTGYQGEGMGFGGLFPSFGIEMDTYENYHLDDPYYDHAALIKHGHMHHDLAITSAVPLDPGKRNVEDCKSHRVKISWQPGEQMIRFYFDQDLRIEQKLDLVGDIFFGDPIVHWGFTSATGGSRNRHLVCLESLDFATVSRLSPKVQKDLLNGGMYILEGIDFAPGSIKLPEGAAQELKKLIRFLKSNKSQTIYLDAFTDSSGDADNNLRLSRKRSEAIAEYLMQKGIPSNRIQHHGYGEENPIAPNESEEGRKRNRRIEVRVGKNRV